MDKKSYSSSPCMCAFHLATDATRKNPLKCLGHGKGCPCFEKMQLSPKPDPESARFIDFAMNKLSDESFYQQLTRSLQKDLVEFYSKSDRTNLLKMLKSKMEQGSIEHGPPRFSTERIKKEVRLEMLDLIGWSMVIYWNDKTKTINNS